MERAELASLLATTGCAEQHGGFTFLIDPHWSAAQRAAFAEISSTLPAPSSTLPAPRSTLTQGWLCIPTGGSSGGLKFARHDEATLGAAARGFAEHFGLSPVNSIDVLPPWHVSGLMARVRSAVTGGRHLPWPWKDLEQGSFPPISASDQWTLSLVPTQLHRLLAQPQAVAWLRQLALIPLGGGPVWPALAEAARAAAIPVVQCYGMTETAAMVCAQRPAEFAAGDDSSGRMLPHARIEIDAADGAIQVAGPSVMRGYFGDATDDASFVTADRGYLDEAGRLHVQGRRDDVVITGGEKVNLRAVADVLRGLQLFDDLALVALPDAEWGEIIVACHTGSAEAVSDQVINRHLSRHQRPKHWLAFAPADWPRNAQGKLNRAVLQAAASARIHPGR
jgi:o-succinylbenzoate---CoA ligase